MPELRTFNLEAPKKRPTHIHHPLVLAVFALFLGGLSLIYTYSVKIDQKVAASSIEAPRVLPLDTAQINFSLKAEAAPDFSEVSAGSFLVFDAKDNNIIAQKNAEKTFPVASLTKLMTVVLSEKYLKNGSVVVTQNDVISINPVLKLKPGDLVSAEDLEKSLLVGSANDAALALGHAISRKTGQSFTYLMNKEAEELGMNNSNFSNSVGFDDNYNFSTAQDISKLISYIRKLSLYQETNRAQKYSFYSQDKNFYSVKATNKLLATNPDILAIKTGYTDNAKGAMAVEVSNDGHPFVILVLHSDDREGDVLKIKEIVQNSYSWQ